MLDETRTRFLTSIAAQIPLERVAEVHLFPAIRQGGMESGVAVLALDLATAPAAPAEVEAAAAADGDAHPDAETEAETDADAAPMTANIEASTAADLLEGSADLKDDVAQPAPPPRRYTVYTARYRHTLKGLDRGKWEVSVTEEADAPLLTVDAVVRGVQRRSGEVDEILRISGDEMRSLLPVPAGQPG